MRGIILGDGPMGRAVATGLRERGEENAVLGRPPAAHPPWVFSDADVVFEFSRGTAGVA